MVWFVLGYVTWGFIETYWEWERDLHESGWFTPGWWMVGIVCLPLLRTGDWVLWIKDKVEKP